MLPRKMVQNTVSDRESVVGDDEILVKKGFNAQSIAIRTSSSGCIVRKKARFDFRDGEARLRAGKFFRKNDPFVVA